MAESRIRAFKETGAKRLAVMSPRCAAGTRLSPLQEAYSAAATHSLGCDWCRDIDRARCEVGIQLWRRYEEIGDAAYRQLPRT